LPFHFAEIWSAGDDGEAQLLQAISVGAIEWLLLMAQKTHAIAKKYGSRISTIFHTAKLTDSRSLSSKTKVSWISHTK
jgi:hypothetical protein